MKSRLPAPGPAFQASILLQGEHPGVESGKTNLSAGKLVGWMGYKRAVTGRS